jgi:GTP cyclohydrolase I
MMQKRDEKSDPERQENGLKQAAQSILVALGEDLQREGLGDTPQRFADLFTDFFCGYRQPKPNCRSLRAIASAVKYHSKKSALPLFANII